MYFTDGVLVHASARHPKSYSKWMVFHKYFPDTLKKTLRVSWHRKAILIPHIREWIVKQMRSEQSNIFFSECGPVSLVYMCWDLTRVNITFIFIVGVSIKRGNSTSSLITSMMWFISFKLRFLSLEMTPNN